MEISEEELEKLTERHYELGRRRALQEQLSRVMRELGIREDLTKEELIDERESVIATLRSICEDHGDNDWDENLHLSDVIDKHLGKYLYQDEE